MSGVDVLAVLTREFDCAVSDGFYEDAQDIHQAKCAVDELIRVLDEMLKSSEYENEAIVAALRRVKGESE